MTFILPEGYTSETRTEDSGKTCITEVFPEHGDFAKTGNGPILKIYTKRGVSGVATFARRYQVEPKSHGYRWETWSCDDFSRYFPHPNVKRATKNTIAAAHETIVGDVEIMQALIAGAFPSGAGMVDQTA